MNKDDALKIFGVLGAEEYHRRINETSEQDKLAAVMAKLREDSAKAALPAVPTEQQAATQQAAKLQRVAQRVSGQPVKPVEPAKPVVAAKSAKPPAPLDVVVVREHKEVNGRTTNKRDPITWTSGVISKLWNGCENHHLGMKVDWIEQRGRFKIVDMALFAEQHHYDKMGVYHMSKIIERKAQDIFTEVRFVTKPCFKQERVLDATGKPKREITPENNKVGRLATTGAKVLGELCFVEWVMNPKMFTGDPSVYLDSLRKQAVEIERFSYKKLWKAYRIAVHPKQPRWKPGTPAVVDQIIAYFADTMSPRKKRSS